jgi:hypothetical protein
VFLPGTVAQHVWDNARSSDMAHLSRIFILILKGENDEENDEM